MQISLKDCWEDIKLSNKVYPLEQNNKKYVDDTFDKLHQQKQMERTSSSTSISLLVFVVWRNILEKNFIKQKGRAVVNIRKLNMIVVKNSYLLPLLNDMIASVRGAYYITLVNVIKFFY